MALGMCAVGKSATAEKPSSSRGGRLKVMIQLVDITKDVVFGIADEEFLPIERCKCGQEFGYWDFFIDDDKKNPTHCPACGRALVFCCGNRVCEVVELDTAAVIAANLQVAVEAG